MSGSEQAQELAGPDFAQGIQIGLIPETGHLVGHSGGEAVLVVRSGQQVYAIGATCSHYGGPLGEGLIFGTTVRCPWHHACFNLITGEAVRAPALNPVACYKVERQGSLVIIREKIDPPKRKAAASPEPVVIVGAGAAGNALAEGLRLQGFEGRIVMLAPEGELPYDRPNLSKDYLAGNAPEEWIPLHPREFYDEQRIELVTARATSFDHEERTVTLDDGTVLPYAALVLATGATPIRLPIPGADLPHVHVLRSLADSRALIAAAQKGQRAVVVGASFIGLEVAAALRAREVEVTVVAPDERPLGRILGPELGDFVRGLHEEHGVVFRLGTKPTEIRPSEVVLDSEEVLPADFVVLGVGVRPNVALAEAAGLEVDNGVVVNEFLETSAPGVYALGDIARFPYARSGEKIRVEHWVVAERQGQVLAGNLIGRSDQFEIAPFFWSQHYDVAINYVGRAPQWDEVEVTGSIAERNAVVLFKTAGRIMAVATIGCDTKSLEAEFAMERLDDELLLEWLAGGAPTLEVGVREDSPQG